MRKDIQEIFRTTPHQKQVMMFSATLSKEIRPVCKKFCQDPMEIYVDDDTKLTLHGLQQYYVKLQEAEKNRKLNDLLDALDFSQVAIFVSKVARARPSSTASCASASYPPSASTRASRRTGASSATRTPRTSNSASSSRPASLAAASTLSASTSSPTTTSPR